METIIVIAIWGNRGQERLSNLPEVVAGWSSSRVWALAGDALLACLLDETRGVGWSQRGAADPGAGDVVVCEVCEVAGVRKDTPTTGDRGCFSLLFPQKEFNDDFSTRLLSA